MIEPTRVTSLRQLMPAAVLAVVLALTWLVYQPGLRGDFIFDDTDNLSALSEHGDLRSWADVERFVLGGISSPMGRPVALASFLLDDDGWPSEAGHFKRTNLLLHLICGLLVALLALRCLRAIQCPPDRTAWAAALAAAIWLLHPLLASTTLYVVQRMAILSTLFVLCGLIVHAYLRFALAKTQRPVPLLLGMAAQLAFFTLLATLSKENGALLPILTAVFEATVLASVGTGPSRTLYRTWLIVVLGLPALLVAAALVYSVVAFTPADAAYRGFTIGQRLLTEGRVLATYLRELLVPQLESGGLYHDDIARSDSLLSPLTTALSWALILGLVTLAWVKRRGYPLLSCAVLFFFAGHLLESTVLPLELFFEHRNYLPATLLAIAGGAGLVQLHRARGRAGSVAAVAVIAVLSLLTWQRALLWSDTDTMFLFWAQKQPASERTQVQAAQVYLKHNLPENALSTLDRGLQTHPSSVSLLTLKLDVLCARRRDHRADFERLITAFHTSAFGPNTYRAMELLFDSPAMSRCASSSADDWRRLSVALRTNDFVTTSPRALQQAYFFEGLAELRLGAYDDAALAFTRALQQRYEYEVGMRMVAELATCASAEALRLLGIIAGRETGTGHIVDIAHMRAEIGKELDHRPLASQQCVETQGAPAQDAGKQ
ncbi:MAG TPA: hypothetical protein VFA81_04750 [Burkholderiales bacterium]|nr:hypothetical protein [Burkholderiales bacterium]